MATAIIKRANRTRYADVIANMRREYSCGLNTYPTTIEQAHNILNKHEALFKLKQRKSGSRFRGRFNNDNDATFFGSLLSLWPGESITDFKLETSLQNHRIASFFSTSTLPQYPILSHLLHHLKLFKNKCSSSHLETTKNTFTTITTLKH